MSGSHLLCMLLLAGVSWSAQTLQAKAHHPNATRISEASSLGLALQLNRSPPNTSWATLGQGDLHLTPWLGVSLLAGVSVDGDGALLVPPTVGVRVRPIGDRDDSIELFGWTAWPVSDVTRDADAHLHYGLGARATTSGQFASSESFRRWWANVAVEVRSEAQLQQQSDVARIREYPYGPPSGDHGRDGAHHHSIAEVGGAAIGIQPAGAIQLSDWEFGLGAELWFHPDPVQQTDGTDRMLTVVASSQATLQLHERLALRTTVQLSFFEEVSIQSQLWCLYLFPN